MVEKDREDILGKKTFAFAKRCVLLGQLLQKKLPGGNAIVESLPVHGEFVLSKQIVRSGTAIGAMVREGKHAQTKPDFIAKFSIALKEAAETEYWLDLLYETNYMDERLYSSLKADQLEIFKMLTASIKTARANL